MSPPRVTVLMTLYNKGPYVVEAIRSVLASTFADLEVLVVDDASTDNGPALVTALADPRVRMLGSAVNTGRADAANRGYDAARGTYIAVMDADDLMHPERIARQVAFMDAHPEVVVCGSWLEAFGAAGLTVRTPATDEEARAQSLFGMPVLYPTAMFRNSVLQHERLRCPAGWRTPGMDYLFMLDVGRHGLYGNLQEPLMQYRVGDQNMRHGRDPISDNMLLFRAVFDGFGIPASTDDVRTHLFFIQLMPPPVNAAQVRAIHSWRATLLNWAAAQKRFPVEALRSQLDRRWEYLFHPLSDRSMGAGFMHWRMSPGARFGQLRYLAGRLLRSRSSAVSDGKIGR